MGKKQYLYLNKLNQSKRLLFNARFIALTVALSVSLVASAIVFFALQISGWTLLGVFVSTALGSAIAVYCCLEFLVFAEINKLYVLLERLKKRDYKQVRKSLKNLTGGPLKKLNKELYSFASKKEQEIDHLKEVETYRREFLADISHELKTPIFSAQGFIHTLLDGAMDDPELGHKFLKKAAKSLDGLNELVNELIYLSHMENGVIQMNLTHFEIGSMVEDIFEMLERKAEKRGTILRWDKKSEKNIWVYADAKRIGQVMVNLLENAIKYGNEKGDVTVCLRTDKENISIVVSDDGPGIAGEHLKRIFERFYRVEQSRSREKGGSGLGLAIVKQIIEAHDSNISVTSRVGKGTTFQFKLKKGNPNAPLQVKEVENLTEKPLDKSIDKGLEKLGFKQTI